MEKLPKLIAWSAVGSVAVVFAIVIAMLFVFLGVSSASASCYPTMENVQSGEVIVEGGPEAEAYLSSSSNGVDNVIAQKKANAAIIIAVGRQKELSEHSVAIGVATALQESGLLNLKYGDRDSLGLFQQRPSVGSWGAPEEILDPVHAAGAFFDALLNVPDRDEMSMMDAAIAVQVPDPAAYRSTWQWDVIATQLVEGTPDSGDTCVGWRVPLDSGYTFVQDYGPRIDPFTGKPAFHHGVDLSISEGTPIYAAHSGVVAFAGPNGGLGNFVKLDNGGNVGTGYGHMVLIAPGIESGVHVNTGDLLGYVGTTGRSTGFHLHFEVYVNGEGVDPEQFMHDLGLELGNPVE